VANNEKVKKHRVGHKKEVRSLSKNSNRNRDTNSVANKKSLREPVKKSNKTRAFFLVGFLKLFWEPRNWRGNRESAGDERDGQGGESCTRKEEQGRQTVQPPPAREEKGEREI
jgi:hypothetical protein